MKINQRPSASPSSCRDNKRKFKVFTYVKSSSAACRFTLAAAFLFAALVIVTACQSNSGSGGASNDERLNARDHTDVIDAHTHLDFDSKIEMLSGIMNSRDEFLSEAKAAGVTGFVTHLPDENTTPAVVPGLTGVFCAGVHDSFSIKTIEAGLRNGKFGCIKIYLGYTYHFPYEDLYKPLYRLAEKMNVPVVFHTGDTSRADGKVKYANPLYIDEVAVDFPHTIFVIAHVGNPWFHSAAEVAYKNANVYVDASGIMIGDLSKYPDTELRKYIIDPVNWVFGYIDNAAKMMFGTDWPLVNIKQYLDVVVRAIPAKDRRAFLHDNAAKVFNIHTL